MATDPRDVLAASRRRQRAITPVTIPNSARFAEELAERVAAAVAQAVTSAVASVLTQIEFPAPVVDITPAVTVEAPAPDLAKPIAAAASVLTASLGPILEQLAVYAAQQPTALIDDDSLDRVLKRVGMPARGRGGPLEVWLKRAGSDERITPATEETLSLLREELLQQLRAEDDRAPVSLSSTQMRALALGLVDYDQRFDYGARTDDLPERIGYAEAGALPSDEVWTIYTHTYDGDNRLILIAESSGQAWE